MNTVVAAPMKHSGLGIASTVIAVLAGLALLGVFGYAGVIGMQSPGGQIADTDPRAMAIGVGLLGCVALLLVGAILGLAGLFVGERKRAWAWAGLVLNVLPVLAAIALVAVGLAMTA
ncbi:MAG: hypothetical protein NDI68_01300 [Arenimonas sp.]|nr:hypothetical protein [Arenimonas sp.]